MPTKTAAPTSKRCANGVHRECTGQREVKMQPFPCGCECHPRCATCNEPMPTRRTTSRCYFCLNLDVVYPGRHHTTDEQYEEWCGESRS